MLRWLFIILLPVLTYTLPAFNAATDSCGTDSTSALADLDSLQVWGRRYNEPEEFTTLLRTKCVRALEGTVDTCALQVEGNWYVRLTTTDISHNMSCPSDWRSLTAPVDVSDTPAPVTRRVLFDVMGRSVDAMRKPGVYFELTERAGTVTVRKLIRL